MFAQILEENAKQDPLDVLQQFIYEFKTSPKHQWSVYSQLKKFEDKYGNLALDHLTTVLCEAIISGKVSSDNIDWLTYGICHVSPVADSNDYLLDEVNTRVHLPLSINIGYNN